MAMDQDDTDTYTLDDVDRGILYELQLNARNTTHEEISEEVGVSPSTVRNRIARLEATDIIETYIPEINYERAGFPLRVQFICTAAPNIRTQCAQQAIELDSIIRIDETITSEQNLCIQVVALDTRNLAEITRQLTELDLQVHTSEIITKTYTKPFTHFERAEERAQSRSRSRQEESQKHTATRRRTSTTRSRSDTTRAYTGSTSNGVNVAGTSSGFASSEPAGCLSSADL